MRKSIPFDTSKSLIVVDAEIFGEGKLKTTLALDTGASITVLSWEVVYSLGYDPLASNKKIRLITGSGIEYCPIVNIAKIEAISKTVQSIDVVCHTLPSESKLDGLLGLNFLKNFDFSIKFSKEVIEVI